MVLEGCSKLFCHHTSPHATSLSIYASSRQSKCGRTGTIISVDSDDSQIFCWFFFHETSASHITFRVFHPSDCGKNSRPYREVSWDVQGESKASADLYMLREWVVPHLLRRSEEELREELECFFENGMEDRFKFLYDDTIAWDWKKRYVVSVREEKLEGQDTSE